MKSTFTGGFGVGESGFTRMKGSYPFAKLSVDDKIYLKIGFWIFTKTYIFELDEVLVKVDVSTLGDSIQIVHNKPEYSSYVYFHSSKLDEITQLLKSKGVLVEICEKTKTQKALRLAFKLYVTIFIILWLGGLLFALGFILCNLLGLI